MPRCAETAAVVAALEERLVTELRRGAAVSYAPQVRTEPLDGEWTHVVATADATRDAAEAAEIFVSTVDELAASGPTGEEIARLASRRRRAATDSRAQAAEAWRAGEDTLSGRAFVPLEQLLDNLAVVSPSRAGEVFRDRAARGLFALPPSASGLFEEAAQFRRERKTPVKGATCRPLSLPGAKTDRRLVLGPEGVTLLDGGNAVTVRVSELVADLRWDGGSRELVDCDGNFVRFDPRRWRSAAKHLSALDSVVADSLVVPMGAEPHRPPCWRQLVRYRGSMSALIGGAVVMWFLTAAIWAGTLNPKPGESGNLMGPLFFTFLSLVMAGALAEKMGLVARWRRHRARGSP
jgi:zinc protease